jgi:cellulose synthase/poly-beta-1,6-N-acetylglucosamine synthase-like glycosyltransferase
MISVSLAILAALVALPVTILFGEVVAAITISQHRDAVPVLRDAKRRVAVLIPAHNESVNLLPTLADVQTQLRPGDRVLLVADNCADDTAAVAAAVNVEVVIRNDPVRKGKGYALDWGLRHLGKDPPDVVIVIDADCRLAEGTIDRLMAACALTNRPVQALDLMTASDEASIDLKVAEFAWRIKNLVRPLGLSALGLPCQLMGTGMAFPWDVICSADLASGMIVEDLKLGLDLAMAGHSPIFCPSACVTSTFPSSAEGAQTQRLRWEKGHIRLILSTSPKLMLLAIVKLNVGLLTMALDIMVPPLSLLVILVVGTLVIDGVSILLGSSPAAMLIGSVNLVGLAGVVLVSWLKYGRDILPFGSISSIIFYVIRKIPLYRDILLRNSDSNWIRTDRKKL